jgi:hypothetical protein
VAVGYSNVFAVWRRCRGVAWRLAAGFATLPGIDGTISKATYGDIDRLFRATD